MWEWHVLSTAFTVKCIFYNDYMYVHVYIFIYVYVGLYVHFNINIGFKFFFLRNSGWCPPWEMVSYTDCVLCIYGVAVLLIYHNRGVLGSSAVQWTCTRGQCVYFDEGQGRGLIL